MKCKICKINETENTSGICYECFTIDFGNINEFLDLKFTKKQLNFIVNLINQATIKALKRGKENNN